ncbi:MAG: glycosyltransferase, partial [Nitrococcus sp.]|nr:glycosyltransferase [Nitrococcus sp.]
PNPTVTPALLEQARSRPQHPWFVPGAPPVVLGVGRLVEHKGFATLLRAFARVRETRPAWLMVLGEGPERSALQRLSAELGIADAVAMPGWVDNPIAYMAGAGILVLSSHWEGLPGVLIEALASGCPVVATDAPGGAAEILDHGAYGKLVRIGDVPAMAAAILETLAHPPDRDRLKARANEFSVERSARRYQEVLCPPDMGTKVANGF